MNYEEKYKEALERAKQVHKYSSDLAEIKRMEEIFPELRESEDEKIRKIITLCLEECVHSDIIRDYEKDKCRAWFEKQVQKSAWSEEDEEIVTGIINDIQERLEDYPTEQLADIYFKEIKWLKFLKQRETWKPSDEQLEALKNAIHINPLENPSDSPLCGLYAQLKKLKG